MSERSGRVSDVNGRASINVDRAVPEDGPKASKVRLDVEKLHSLPSEQQDLYLFTFSVELLDYIESLEIDDLNAKQEALNAQIFKILNLSSPVPSKAVRNQLGRSFARVLGKGNRKTLFETVNKLVAVISTGKGEKDIQNKHAAAYCLGEVYKAAGDSAINLSILVSTTLLRLLKPAQNHAGTRAAVFGALGKVVETIQGSLDETIARDIWKQARSVATSDKAALVQARACICLEQLARHTTYFGNTNDFENLKTTIWRVSETSVISTRHAAASSLAAALTKSYSENALSKTAPKPKRPKRPRTQSAVMEEVVEEIPRPESPSSAKKASVKLELSLSEILRQLSTQYVRSISNNKVRAMIAHCYVKIFRQFEPSTIETAYGQILEHFLTDLLSNPSLSFDRHRLLLTRKFVHKILADCIGSNILGESGRLTAARSIVNNVLKNYPRVIKETVEPSKQALVGALDALAALVKSLGSAFRPLAESCREALVQVLAHPSYTVQVHAANALRIFVLECPQQLLSCASICMNCLHRELGLLTSARQSPRRCIGYANGLGAVLGITPSQPLYSSLEICSRVLSTANDLLKSSSQADLRLASVQVRVAWILIGGLMALGPAFVKIHLSQFLLLWRNALPKPLNRENTAQRSSVEIAYLAHVRECTLGSILLFLEFNSRLVTIDVAKRIATMLQNTNEFLDNFPNKKAFDDPSLKAMASLSMRDLVQMVRRRVLQCYSRLIAFSPGASGDILSQSNLVTSAVSLFAEPEAYSPGTLGSSIANTAGTFESIWDVADNSAFGLTGLVRGPIIARLPGEHSSTQERGDDASHGEIWSIDAALVNPISGAQEYDSVYLQQSNKNDNLELPDPPATEVVNAAIALFSVALPLQSPRVQEGSLEQLATFLASPALHRDPGRRAAVMVNSAMALLGALKVAVGETKAENGDLKHLTVERILEELLRMLLADQDPYIRHVAYEALGRLCNNSGHVFTTNQVNSLIDTIVSNRDPHVRAGCAMGLGSIHHQVGGMAAGLHLKKINGILLSLCSDPSPVVHFSAIEALSRVADSAGLTYSAYVSSTLGLLAQLWTCDSHNEESSSFSTSNAEIESPTAAAIAQCIDSLINVLGPDLQDMRKTRELMLTLLKQFDLDKLPTVQAKSLRAWEHTYLYDPLHVDIGTYVRRIQSDLDSPISLVRENAIDGLYNLMRKDAERVLRVAQSGLEDQIWQALNDDPKNDGIRNVIQSWLGQSSLTDTDRWITRCQQVLTKTTHVQVEVTPPPEPKSAVPDLQDEEVAGFASTDVKEQDGTSLPEVAKELLRWQVRSFAMQCLNDLVTIIGKDMDLDPESNAGQALQNRIADIIRLAFLASTASVTELQVRGLRLIDQVLKIFGSTADPDFQEALLLEQYQAQISSALTPAFAGDSSPDLASAAVDVCATFISTGLVTDVERMGRILKLLVTALESFTNDTQDSAVGELRGLSSNAQTMIRMAVLSAWAELQVASTQQEYLVKVVKPHVAKLTPLWLSSLQDFARLRFEPDISSSMGPARPDEGLDVIYAALNRQTLLKFYQDSWLKLVDAIASLIDQDSEFVFDALDGKLNNATANGITEADRDDINYRDEPAAFFFVLFGIVIEALTTRPSGDGQHSESHTLEILSALRRIVRPSVSGHAIFQDSVFSETVELFDRLALTEGLDVQLVIIDIARDLCMAHPSARVKDDNEERLSDDIEQLFELTRVMVLVLAGVLPNLSEQNPSARHQLPDEAVAVIQNALEALADAADIFPSIIKTDLHASILHVFATILGTGMCQANVVPQALPVFKRFLRSMPSPRSTSPSSESTDLVRACLRRFLSILSHAQRRESESSLPCARNTILACTILLTTASSHLAPSDPLITRALDDMLDCLPDLGLAKVAANCLRSLILVNPKNATDAAIARHVIPRLVHFTIDTSTQDPEDARSLTAHALTSFVATTSGESSSAAMSVVIPALLTRASAEGRERYSETARRLLELAGGQLMPVFKGVVAKMSAGQRSFMETVIREGGGAGDGAGSGRRGSTLEREEPKIALKMDFGG